MTTVLPSRPGAASQRQPRGSGAVGAVLAVLAIALTDIRVALTGKMTMVQAVSLPVNYLIAMSLFALAGSHAPAALVLDEHGSYARQFAVAVQHARTFRLAVESQAQAGAQLAAGTLVAEITVPAGFDRAIRAHQPVAVNVMVNNVDEDLTDDAERGMRLALEQFYSAVSPGQVPVTVAEHDQYPRDTGYIPYLAVSIVVIALMVAGLLQAGSAAARAWEDSTVTGLLAAPVRTWQVLAGRMLGAFVVSLPAAVVVLAVVVFIAGDHPLHAAAAAGVALLTLAVFTAAGVALGTITRDRSLVATITRAVPVPLFFLAGVFGPLSYQTVPVQVIGEILPLHWAIVLTQWAFLGYPPGPVPLAADAGILAGWLALFIASAAAALHRARRVRSRPLPALPPVAAGRWHRPAWWRRPPSAGPAARPRRPAAAATAPTAAAAPTAATALPPSAGTGPPVAARWLLGAWAVCAKDLLTWFHRPWLVITTLLVPVSYTLVAFLGSAATGANPVAVVNLDHGPAGTQIVRAIQAAQVFRLREVGPAAARGMYDGEQVAAVVTIPAGTSGLIASHRRASVQVQVDNQNLDIADDVRRAVPDALISWAGATGRQRAGPVRVSLAQHLRIGRDVQLYQYSILPVLVLVITVCGILVAGMAAAEEFERKTVKGLLSAPVPRWVIVAGKMTAGWAFTAMVAAAVLVAGAALGWTRPASPAGWAQAFAAIILGAGFAAGLGVAIGICGRRRQPVSIAATIASVELFALSGGIGVIWFEPAWLQAIARFDPLTYAIRLLQQAVFYGSTAGAWTDTLILAGCAAAAALTGAAFMYRALER